MFTTMRIVCIIALKYGELAGMVKISTTLKYLIITARLDMQLHYVTQILQIPLLNCNNFNG